MQHMPAEQAAPNCGGLPDSIARMPQILAAYEDWWESRNDNPIFYGIHGEPGFDWAPVRRDWMPERIVAGWSNWMQENLFGRAMQLIQQTGDWRYLEEAIAALAYYSEHTHHVGQGFSFLMPNLGPGCIAAFLSGESTFKDTTIWLEPEREWDWDRLLAIDPQRLDPYYDLCLEGVRRLKAALGERFVFSLPDLGEPMDILSSLHGNAELCMDLVDEPDDVQEVAGRIEQVLWRCYEDFGAILYTDNHGGYVEQMRWLSGKPTRTVYCDFSALISPDMFGEFVLPQVQRSCERMEGRTVFHLDGPGELPHVDQLLAVENLHAIQWVQGAGNPGSLDPCWYELYGRIIDAGKHICLCGVGDADALKALFDRFPKKHFLVPAGGERDQLEELLRVCER